MLKLFKKIKAQALIELAILGPLVIVAAGILITYTATVNDQQYFLMESFRYSLKKAHAKNKDTAYGTFDDRPQVSINKPIIGEEMTSGGAGYIMWSINGVRDGSQEDPQEQVWAKLNDWGDIPGVPNEHDVTSAGSTSVEPTTIIITSDNTNVTNNNGSISSSRSGSMVGAYAYKVGKNYWTGYARARGGGSSYHANVN